MDNQENMIAILDGKITIQVKTNKVTSKIHRSNETKIEMSKMETFILIC